MNYVMDGPDRMLIRSGPGPKLQAAARRAVVTFEVDEIDELSRTGWSVVVTAQASIVSRDDAAQVSRAGQPWASGPRGAVICLQVRRIDGRRLN